MNLASLALRNIIGSRFRSLIVVLCVLLVAGFSLFTSIAIDGAEHSLELAVQRLGADLVVIPEGVDPQGEGALFAGKSLAVWMPEKNLEKVRAVKGVAAASSQLYLGSVPDAPYCTAAEALLVAFDPTTDFTVQPWLQRGLGRPLGPREVVGGSFLRTPTTSDNITVGGYDVRLVGNLERTGNDLDQTLFMTFDTAREAAATAKARGEASYEFPADSVSAILVKVEQGANPREVALQIMLDVPGITPVQSPDLFQAFRRQMNGLRWSVLVAMTITWVVGVSLIGLVFSIAANERRREMGMLRALGSTRRFVFLSLVVEALLLALSGGIAGTVVSAGFTYAFRDAIVGALNVPLVLPGLGGLAEVFGVGLAVALLTVALAAMLPAIRVSRQDPAVAMRE